MTAFKDCLLLLFLLLCPLLALHIPYNVSTGTNPVVRPICIDARLYPQWATSRLQPKDCYAAAVVGFYGREMEHEHVEFEFVAPGASSRTVYGFQRTPRKYVYGRLLTHKHRKQGLTVRGSCVMAIVMLSTFDPGQVPGLGVDLQRSHTDVASYAEIWTVTKRILDQCIDKYCTTCPRGVNYLSNVGWGYAGKRCPCFGHGTR